MFKIRIVGGEFFFNQICVKLILQTKSESDLFLYIYEKSLKIFLQKVYFVVKKNSWKLSGIQIKYI